MKVTPLSKLGAEVTEIDLEKQLTDEEVDRIRDLVHHYRLVVFRDQQGLSADGHMRLTQKLGGCDTAVVNGDPLFQHPKSPHPDIYRISNDPDEGCTDAGRSGWHVDGGALEKPFAFTTLHVLSAPTRGATEFVGFSELLDSVTPEKRAGWARLWTVPDRSNGTINPLLHRHPVSNKEVMLFHLGFTKQFIWDYGTDKERVTDETETAAIKEDITSEIRKNGGELVYAHPWRTGDLGVSDNLAVGHFASDDSQRPRAEVGLRVLHRTTIRGTCAPSKQVRQQPGVLGQA